MDRELITATLFDRLTTSPDILAQGFVTFGRDNPGPTKITAWNALFLVNGNEFWPSATGKDARLSTRPAEVMLEFLLWIYAKAPSGVLRDAMMNNIRGAIDKALAPDRGYRQTLGLRGVLYCRVEGLVIRAPAPAADQIYCHVPILVDVIEGVETEVIP